MKRNRGWSAIAPFFVYFRKGENEYDPEDGGTVVEPKNAPKAGRWLVFERQPVLRFQRLPNQGWAPPPKPSNKPIKIPTGWVAMTDLAFIRSLLAQ